ncbi:hypothetical protein [Rhizobium sp. YTUHZ044]|uniref:hypothetical protein n=1 Tax=Rhizobium sp. YTUHZ044 TaxID=2962678 RepID=UPI003DA9EC96
MMHFSRLLVAVFLFFAPVSAFAVNPDEVLADPALEARARSECDGGHEQFDEDQSGMTARSLAYL